MIRPLLSLTLLTLLIGSTLFAQQPQPQPPEPKSQDPKSQPDPKSKPPEPELTEYEAAQKLVDQIVDSVKGITKTLEVIEDEKTIKDSMPILEVQIEDLRILQSKAQEIRLTDEEKKKLGEIYRLRVQESIKTFTREMVRVSKMPEDLSKPVMDLLRRARPFQQRRR